MDKAITINIKGNTKQAEAVIERLSKKIAKLNQQGVSHSPYSDSQMRDFQQVARQYEKINQLSKKHQQLVYGQLKAEIRMQQDASRQKTAIVEAEAKKFAEAEKSKARIAEITARRHAQESIQAARAAENAKKREYQEYVKLEREKTRVARSESKKRFNYERVGGGFQSAGDGLQNAGSTLTATVSAPLIALATFGVKSALELDKVRTKLIALEGDAEKANKKMAELQNLANNSVGVTQKAAFETFAQLKGIGGVADDTIKKVIVSVGKLNSAFKIDDQAGFIQNLNQIFAQGFERSDIKEAIGRVPFFEQLLEQAFGTKDGAKLKQLKESGKLTLDTFLAGMSNAINTDPRIAGIGENLSVKMEKALERMDVALAPLGDFILQTVVPAMEKLAPYVQKLGEYFNQLSAPVKTVVLILAGLAAASGPVLLAIGGIASAIGGIVSAIGAVGGISLAPIVAIFAGIGVALGAVAVAAYALYQAWTKNIGGIQETAQEVFNNLKTIIQPAIDEIVSFVQQGVSDIVSWVDENLPDMVKAVQQVVKAISFLWAEHGDQIKEIVSSAWTIVKTLIVETVRYIGNVIKLVVAVINGDWGKAWQVFKQMVDNGVKASITILKSLVNIVWQLLKALVTPMISIAKDLYNRAVDIGKNIIDGLVNGISNLASRVYEKAKEVASTALGWIKSVFDVQSPSKETTKIGEFVSEGLAVGMENRIGKVSASAKKVAAEALKQLKEAINSFNKLAGASPETVGNIQKANVYSDAANQQQEIIKLRAELGQNNYKPLPDTVSGTARELADLQAKKKAQDEFNKSLEDQYQASLDLDALIEKEKLDFEERIRNLESAGAIQLLNLQEEIELSYQTNDLEKQRIKNGFEIKRLREEMANDGYTQEQIDQEAEIVRLQQAQQLELGRILEIRKQVNEATELGKNLDEKLFDAQRNGRDLTEYEKTLRKINEDWKDISEAQKEELLNKAAQIDAQKQYNEAWQTTYDFIRDSFDLLTDSSKSWSEKLRSFFGGIAQSFKKMLFDMAAQWVTSKIFKNNTGSGVQTSSGGFGGIFDIFKNIFGGGNGSIGTPVFNPNYRQFADGNIPANQLPTGSIDAAGNYVVNGSQSSGGIFGNLKNLFSTKEGGIFAPQKTVFGGESKLAGIIGGVGSLATLAGGLIGGRFGGILSSAGTGAQIGAMFGPWGAAIGAGIGALVGIFGGDPKRKRDKKEKLPQLQSGFADALQQLRQLLQDTKSLRVDPDSALSKAQELRQAIASGFGLSFESKKYKKIAASQIQGKLSEADSIIARLRNAADMARAANDRNRRILPEFSTGGFIPGIFDGKDNVLARLSKGEVVLNPVQISRMRALVGFDPISHIGVPNYPKKEAMPRFADGGVVSGFMSPSSGELNVKVELHNVTVNENSAMVLTSPSGQRQIVEIWKYAAKNGEIRKGDFKV